MSTHEPDQSAFPVVLCFSGHDPSGGAGIQADIEAIKAAGAHPATVITALTVQDTANVDSFTPVAASLQKQQADKILADMPVKAIKIGMTGDIATINMLIALIDQYPDIPVILDPVLAAGGGQSLSAPDMQAFLDAILDLIKRCTLITPNIPEVLALSQQTETEEASQHLKDITQGSVLITGSHAPKQELEQGDEIHHKLLTEDKIIQFSNKRLPAEYHGSGCTLASSIAAQLAIGASMIEAVKVGLNDTFASLANAYPAGKGQLIPGRITASIHKNAGHVRMLRIDGNTSVKEPLSALQQNLSGLYAITDEQLIGLYLLPAVEQALQGGARIIQYRNKSTNQSRRLQQAQALRELCNQYDALLIINDDIELALEVAADGVHIGQHDAALATAREKLGADKVIGVSCYNDIELARQAEQQGADYIAFGAFFSSSIKPNAASASLDLLEQAKTELSTPVCCIGGITAENAAPLISAGADMLAVISDLFARSPEDDGIRKAAEQLDTMLSS